MRRRTFDLMMSSVGLILAVVMFIAGLLGIWAYKFTTDQVTEQLSAQQIFFPPAGSKAIEGPEYAALQQYAGQQLTTGPQAEAYANHFIAVHLEEVAGGKTYAEVSSANQANPTPELTAQANTLFKGETLRGLLLTAYAFYQVGQIALVAGLLFLGGSVLLLIFSILGFTHAHRVSDDAEVLAGGKGAAAGKDTTDTSSEKVPASADKATAEAKEAASDAAGSASAES